MLSGSIRGVNHLKCVRVLRSGQPSVWPVGGLVCVHVRALICEILLISSRAVVQFMQLDCKMLYPMRDGGSRIGTKSVPFSACFLLSGYFSSPPVCLSVCPQVSTPFFLSIFYMDALIHPAAHSAHHPVVVSDSYVLSSSHTYSQGVVKVGSGFATVIALGGPDYTWVWWIGRAGTAVATRMIKCVHRITAWKGRE